MLAGKLNPTGECSPGAEWCMGGEVDGLCTLGSLPSVPKRALKEIIDKSDS
jgi:hypothetical protein